ncbi:hypothetical protein NHX12_017956 [Muraenolepis orangiensis]|uniref:Uncharacterized protein n=1 Tax=Muraenolepis orangiensis TaxID=630683 RepID=A0A9Q0IUZ1_9TELE|nr:hypothetical protein NHX12_017956 [Muraenolepis orangiensis]
MGTGSRRHRASLEALELPDSITAFFHNSNQTHKTTYTQINHFGRSCTSLDGGAIAILAYAGQFNLTGVFLRTSCLVMRWNVNFGRKVSLDVYLLSTSSGKRQAERPEMEYRAQLECLGLPPPVGMSPTLELCPEETSTWSS